MDNYKNIINLFLDKTKTIISQYPISFGEVSECKDGLYFSNENKGKMKDFMDIMNWTTSFFSGMALLSYQTSGDTTFLQWVNSKNNLYHAKVFVHSEDTMHDLGFLYSLHSVAIYKITGDPYSREIALKAADELAKRFVLKGGYIEAWGRMNRTIPEHLSKEEGNNHFYSESQGLAIIDCMMNLPLLYWAWSETGNPFYRDIANSHADMTAQLFIREDASVYHAYRFDPVSGKPIGGCNYCGFGNESYWARGTTWAIYGFVIAYSYTHNPVFLELSIKIAKGFIAQLTHEDSVPVWDFRLPKGQEPNKDTSAAVIAASAFFEIIKYQREVELEKYAYLILDAITDERYTNYDINVPGILKEQNGKNVYTSFGDYFYYEAICKACEIKRDLYW